MLTIKITPLKAEDILYVIENGVREVQLKATPDKDMAQLAKESEESGLCITGWVDGKVIGVGGIKILWEGVGEVWALFTSYKKSKGAYKCIRDGLEKLIEDNKLRRIQGYGRIGFPQSHILFKHLGFKPEGIMRKYTPDGVDVIMYARIEDGTN